MPKALSDMFAEARSAQIELDGEPAYGIYELTPAPEYLIVELVRAAVTPVQGLALKADGGLLEINNQKSQYMNLWHDTAPDRVTVRVNPEAGKVATLKIWNIWRGRVGGTDVTQAWLGNSGMRAEWSSDGKELVLRCSDGEGPIDFDNLEARVQLAA